jgi:chromosome segregation ATPase
MAKSPSARIDELVWVVETIEEQVSDLQDEMELLQDSVQADVDRNRQTLATLTEKVIRLEERLDQLRRELGTSGVAELRQELALVRQLSTDQQKRIDKWDTRLWAVVAAVLLFLMSSMMTLVTALSKK